MRFAVLAALALAASALKTENVVRSKATHKVSQAEMLNALQHMKRMHAIQRIEELETYVDNGLAVELHQGVDKHSMASKITEQEYSKMLHEFTDAAGGTRFVGHEGNRKAADYIMKLFEQSGLATKEHSFFYDIPGVNPLTELLKKKQRNGNIAGFKKGTDLASEVIVVGAHYDSVNWKTPGQNAPGVDDNASGMAALLLIAQAIAKHQPRRSVLLVAFNAEEEGLLGSKAFVRGPVANKEYGEVKAALIADEIAFPGRQHFAKRAIFETRGKHDGHKALVDTMAHNIEDSLGGVSGVDVNWKGFGSDHISFLDANIPAVLLIERDDEWHADGVGHSDKDTFEGLDMKFGASMSRLLFRSLLHLVNPSK